MATGPKYEMACIRASTGHVSWSDCGHRSVRSVDDSLGPETAACFVSYWPVTSDVVMIISTGSAGEFHSFSPSAGIPACIRQCPPKSTSRQAMC